ncbi:hypothetical protein ACFXTN_031314 [Malus domestica]
MNDEVWVKWINELEPIFKRKWMNNDIYELIMLSKTTVVAKPELPNTVLLFWNSSTNTFDFRIGPMSPTILDMAQVFGLRPSDRIVDVTYAPHSCPIAESSGASASLFQLEYNYATFKSYETSFKGFIPFVKKNFGADSSKANLNQEHMYFLLYWLNKHGEPFETNLNGPIWMVQLWLKWYFLEFRAANLEFPEAQCNPAEMDVGQDEDAADAFVLQEVVAKVERKNVGAGGDVSELFRDLEGKVEPKAKTWASKRAQTVMVETSNFEPEK